MDAATLLDHFTHDLANIPDEAKYMLTELKKKDLEYDKILTKIQNSDSQLYKYIKQHGSLIRHPKEDALNNEITKLYEQARIIQNDKILLANTALLNITKHASKFERDIRRGIETGTIENWDVVDEDIEMTDYLPINGTNIIKLNSPSPFDATSTPPPPFPNKKINGSKDINSLTQKLSNSSIENKNQKPPKKSREKTPILNISSSSSSSVNNSTALTKETSIIKKPEVAAGTVIKGLNRRMLGANNVNGVKNENGGTGNGDDDELYCFCQQVSYGAMVACDNPNCKYEWFHYDCVGLKEPPVGVWYCPECRKDVKKDTKKEKKRNIK